MGGVNEIPFNGIKRNCSNLNSVPVLDPMAHTIQYSLVFPLKKCGICLGPRSRVVLETIIFVQLFKELAAST